MTKECSSCSLHKDLSEFQPKKRYKYGVHSVCRQCYNHVMSEWRKNNPDKVKEANKRAYWNNPEKAKQKARNGRFKAKYWPHLSIKDAGKEWDKIYAAQNGKCSICKLPKTLDVEHCHKTSKVRSLACNDCNTALARLHENKEIALAIIKYIEKHNDN